MDCEKCGEKAVYTVYERYLASDGVGAVERGERLCSDCVESVTPECLDQSYPRYEFRIQPAPEAAGMGTVQNDG